MALQQWRLQIKGIDEAMGEPMPNIDRNELRNVIQKKCEILIQGAKKRKLPVVWYEQLIEKVSE